MHVSDGLVKEFQKKYGQKFGQSISAKEAELNIMNLADLIRLLITKQGERNE